MRFVAVTACPTGIAHSEMAAEALETEARRRGHEIQVEVHGASGAETIDPAVIANAQAVIFAVDAGVRERERFAHLPSVQLRTREAIDKPGEALDRAEAAVRRGAAEAPAAAAEPARPAEPEPARGPGFGGELRNWLMTGVSYMIPFVVAGGILIALAFAIGGAVEVTEWEIGQPFSLGGLLYTIGNTAFSMLVPILSGFIAYAMADRPGIAPGIVGGLLATTLASSVEGAPSYNAGFLGGIISGLLAGATVNLLKKIPVKGTLARMMPVLVYPVVGTLIVGALMILVVVQPVAAINTGLTDWLSGLSGANAILLGIILGAMMAFDMGGPVNKSAYAFGIAALAAGQYAPMAAVMAAGMVPPLAMALATTMRRRLYNEAEIRAGEAGWLMGASFITEGAIPFAAADPIRVIPAMMVGSAIAAVLSLVFGATLRAPHGGLWVVGLIGRWPLYLLAIAIGTVVSAVLVNVLKSYGGKSPATAAVRNHTTEAVNA
jgi:PTS system fructose-specific IIC component